MKSLFLVGLAATLLISCMPLGFSLCDNSKCGNLAGTWIASGDHEVRLDIFSAFVQDPSQPCGFTFKGKIKTKSYERDLSGRCYADESSGVPSEADGLELDGKDFTIHKIDLSKGTLLYQTPEIWVVLSKAGETEQTPTDPCQASCKQSGADLVWDGRSDYPGCICRCDDGFGMNEKRNCEPCGAICRSRNNNEISDPAECVGGMCKCICDLENGYHYNEQGVCVTGLESPIKDLDSALINALRGNDLIATERALIPYLTNKNENIRLLAILGFTQCLGRQESTLYEDYPDIATAAKISSIRDKDLWLLVNPNWRE